MAPKWGELGKLEEQKKAPWLEPCPFYVSVWAPLCARHMERTASMLSPWPPVTQTPMKSVCWFQILPVLLSQLCPHPGHTSRIPVGLGLLFGQWQCSNSVALLLCHLYLKKQLSLGLWRRGKEQRPGHSSRLGLDMLRCGVDHVCFSSPGQFESRGLAPQQ